MAPAAESFDGVNVSELIELFNQLATRSFSSSSSPPPPPLSPSPSSSSRTAAAKKPVDAALAVAFQRALSQATLKQRAQDDSFLVQQEEFLLRQQLLEHEHLELQRQRTDLLELRNELARKEMDLQRLQYDLACGRSNASSVSPSMLQDYQTAVLTLQQRIFTLESDLEDKERDLFHQGEAQDREQTEAWIREEAAQRQREILQQLMARWEMERKDGELARVLADEERARQLQLAHDDQASEQEVQRLVLRDRDRQERRQQMKQKQKELQQKQQQQQSYYRRPSGGLFAGFVSPSSAFKSSSSTSTASTPSPTSPSSRRSSVLFGKLMGGGGGKTGSG